MRLTHWIANGGIGFELAKQLLEKGTYHVLLGSRSEEKGTAALKDLQSQNLPGSTELLQIDATSDESIQAAAKTVEKTHEKLDILVNNAALAGVPDRSLREQMRLTFDTNATGVAIIVNEFTPLLRKSDEPRVINVTTALSSIGQKLDSSSPYHKMSAIQYRATKSALNMITACQWVELKDEGFKVFSYCPGFTVSNLGPRNTAEYGAKPTEEAVYGLVDIVEGKRDDEAGGFLHAEGGEEGQYPW